MSALRALQDSVKPEWDGDDGDTSSISEKSFDPDMIPAGQDKSYDASILFFESEDEVENSDEDNDLDRPGSKTRFPVSNITNEYRSKENAHDLENKVVQTISAQVAEKAIASLQNVASREVLRLRSEIEKLTRKNLKLRSALHESEEKLSKSLMLVNR
jgi:hypothetical protein